MKIIVDWNKFVETLVTLNAPICVLMLTALALRVPYALELMALACGVMAVLSIGCVALFFYAALRDSRQVAHQEIAQR